MSKCPMAPFADLGSFLAQLEHKGRVRRVTKPVDKDWEIACLARWALESTPEQDAYALLFENVKNHSGTVAVNLFSTPALYASALGVSAAELLEVWAQALENTRKLVEVGNGPVFEVVRKGEQADARRLPVPVWTPGRDGGAYLTAASVITKDPETGIQNVGIYRMQIHDDRSIGLCFASKKQHGAMHYAKYAQRQEPMPVAAVIGAPPVVSFAAAAKTAYGVDEMEVAGGLAGAAVEVVRGKTVDLLIPARAECVIEGVVEPNAQRIEGPFGEALGYMAGPAPAPVVNVTAICHRAAPIHHGYMQQVPPSEGHFVMEMGCLGPLWFYLTRKLKMKGLADIAIARGSAGLGIVVAQIKRECARDAAALGGALTKFNLGQRFIYLVDEDIDIRDQDSVNWALTSRVDPERDIEFIKDCPSYQYDPSTLARAAAQGRELGEPPYPSSICIVDATVKCSVPEIAMPGRAAMYDALRNWEATGLPPIVPRRRLERLLRTHPDALPLTITGPDEND